MSDKITNLVFEGGGILGISYLGILDFLHHQGMLQSIRRVAGTSAGAMMACMTSLNLPYDELKTMSGTLNFKKIPQKVVQSDPPKISSAFRDQFKKVFGSDVDSVYRLIKSFGWYSSEYLYTWMKEQISSQFNHSLKQPPYTFADFKNPYIHKGQRSFLDLYVVGTDISTKSSKVFCYETTPDMEVAKAIRVSMSIPLFFESVILNETGSSYRARPHIFADGGIMRNYPITLFDSKYFTNKMTTAVNRETLGIRFKKKEKYREINSIIGYIESLIRSYLTIQQDIYNNSPQDQSRSIVIDTKDTSFVDFDITPNDEKYKFLYQQGYKAAQDYFQTKTSKLKPY